MRLSKNIGLRLNYSSAALCLSLVLAGCAQDGTGDGGSGEGDVVTNSQQSALISQQVDAEIARSAAQASASLKTLQQAQAPISTPVTSNVLTPSTPAPVYTAPTSRHSRHVDLDAAYVPPDGSPLNSYIATPAAPTATPSPAKVSLAGLPPALTQPLTIKWAGPVAGSLQEIADRIGYRYEQSGPDTGSHPNIFLNETNSPAADVLSDVGLQVQHYGKVNVDPAAQTISFELD